MNEKEFKSLIKQIEKEHGAGTIMLLDDETKHKNIETIPTGSLLLDKALGVGGYPKGRIIEIFGPESSGKTTMTLHAIAEIQKKGGVAAFIDAEHAIDMKYAEKLGVDIKKLIISQPDSGEQALEIADQLINSGMVDLVVVDSVAALVPLAELEGRMDEHTVGAQARLMSKSLRKMSGSINKTQTTVIFINQIREKIGVMFGNPETTPGGRALKFFSSVRLDIRLKERINENGEQIGQKVKIKVIKNKVSPPYKVVEPEIYYNDGINQKIELIQLAAEEGVIEKSGSWYSYKGEKLGQGSRKAAEALEDKKLYNEIYKKTMKTK